MAAAEVTDWGAWLSRHTTTGSTIDEDFGLAKIAEQLNKTAALSLYWEGVAMEGEGDVEGGIRLYRKAFHQWPALDSVSVGGLPLGVREEAQAAGLDTCLLAVVDVSLARASRAVVGTAVLTADDIRTVEAVRARIAETEALLDNNPQNATHSYKAATFLNNGPAHAMIQEAPHVVGKLMQFAMRSWEEQEWGGTRDQRGPLSDLVGGVPALSIRVVEHWEYSVGGGLVDPLHYDVDSVVTIVAQLTEATDCEGGVFRTNEPDGTQLEHRMNQGDAVCFVSHKYHNITPLTKGVRKSLVIELWQGGTTHMGR